MKKGISKKKKENSKLKEINNHIEDNKFEDSDSTSYKSRKNSKNNNKNISFTSKKPLNAYYLFCQEKIKENKNKQNLNFKMLSSMWINLPEEKINEYINKFNLLESNEKEKKKTETKNKKRCVKNSKEYSFSEEKFSSMIYSCNLDLKRKIRKSISQMKLTKNNKLDDSFEKENENNNIKKDKRNNELSLIKKRKKKIIKSSNISFKRKKI